MKILLIYGSLSGSTMTAAELVAGALKTAGHEVNVISSESATKELLLGSEALILGSPSWEDQGKDGQPLPEITAFLGSLTAADVANKKVALFGLGDISYPHFCGAVDVMAEKLKELGVTPVVASLKIDRYYSLPDNEQKVKDWAENLAKTLQS